MRSHLATPLKPLLHFLPQLLSIFQTLQVSQLILETPPQSLDEDVIVIPPPPIRTNFYSRCLQYLVHQSLNLLVVDSVSIRSQKHSHERDCHRTAFRDIAN